MDTAAILREKTAQIEKLWSDIGKIIDSDSLAGIAYDDYDLYALRKAIELGDF
jgi:hypothetical protein